MPSQTTPLVQPASQWASWSRTLQLRSPCGARLSLSVTVGWRPAALLDDLADAAALGHWQLDEPSETSSQRWAKVLGLYANPGSMGVDVDVFQCRDAAWFSVHARPGVNPDGRRTGFAMYVRDAELAERSAKALAAGTLRPCSAAPGISFAAPAVLEPRAA